MVKRKWGRYRGCDIYYEMLEARGRWRARYESPCVSGYYWSLRDIKTVIDKVKRREEREEEEERRRRPRREREIYVGRHRGCDMYYYPPGVVTELGVYASPCIGGYYKTLGALKRHIDKWWQERREETPPPPAPPGGPDETDRERAAQAWEIIRQIEEMWAKLLAGQVTESAFQAFLDDANRRLKALDWPEWTPPKVPPKTGEEATVKMAEGVDEIVSILKQYGVTPPVRVSGKILSDMLAVTKQQMETSGVTDDVVLAAAESPVNRERAAELAKGIGTGALSAIAGLSAAGIAAEVASMGQIEKVADGLLKMADAAGLGYLGTILATLPYQEMVIEPARQFWRSKALAYVPPVEMLREMAVKEAFPVPGGEPQYREMEKWARWHGMDPYWTERYLWAGFNRMDVDIAIANYYWGYWSDEDLKRFLRIADIHPDDWEPILRTIWRNPSRLERRHGYIMGVYSREDLIKYFRRDGLSPEDAETAADAMIAYALEARRNAVYRAGGRIYRDRLRAISKELEEGDIDERTANLMRRRAREEYLHLLDETRKITDWRELWALRYELEAEAGQPTLEELEDWLREVLEAE